MDKELLATRKYKAGYEVRTEKHLVGDDKQEVIIKSAFTPSGDYLGDPRTARYLIRRKGIKPEKAKPSHNVCSIGFCEAEQKWYGWSHRAIYGFRVGDTVTKGDCTASSGLTAEYLKEYPGQDGSLPIGFTARTIEDARRMAVAFAASVS
ncbi:hypothetical protein LCGC14_0598940 [marine sediment metagenome]|uniref:Uncharacterized protein n=1 Tax=marine sediment metagenome TaxID=412755 RepID=A0A0F9TXH2_9ZZZZ